MGSNEFIGDRVIEVLRNSDFDDFADQIEDAIKNLKSKDINTRMEAVEFILGMCHARALGDLSVPPLNGNDWYKMLEKLAAYAKSKS
ncbi:hypothetical protein CWI80_08775 [Pseudidiomarina sediminum]|uniref:Uncharacterized protein n=1 Tax=Pseudidiomarina sediminum TaxID=431675 RepID=A0A432Z485_9GAMM|nr:hypothetical protein [Pseudidiomarina sediminum]RUO72629.1 hypothetical protein CWI80_08775 [Pseudidiomarina sediminum]